MQLSTTDLIAIYAAIVATFVLIWDIVKWATSGARLRVHAKCDVFYSDSRVIKVTPTESGQSQQLADYCHIEVSNIGDQPATILSIVATHKSKKGKGQMFMSGPAFTPHFGKSLPHVLGPGEVWSARLEMPNLHQLAQRGRPVMQISTSKSQRPLTIAPKFSVSK
jgi:hypothetical protein